MLNLMKTPSAPKGTRDFYPEDIAVREYIFSSWEKTCQRYGFEPYDGPIFEHLEIFTKKSGDEIEKQLYSFEDKGGRMLALRPELTPTLARMVASRGSSLKRPIRWFSIPSLFRYERMQKGRLRQFYQLNMDILGCAEVIADAEMIAAVVAMMTDLGFTLDDFRIHISSRTLLNELFAEIGVPGNCSTALYAILDKRHRIPEDEFFREINSLLADNRLAEIVLNLLSSTHIHNLEKLYPNMTSVKELADLFILLGDYGISEYALFDIGIVRGLAYYTGIVFEVFDIKRSFRAIAGGGRYDRLISLFGGPDTPAVGFAAGDVILAELLREKGIVIGQGPRSEVFIVSVDRENHKTSIQTAQNIRKAGISCEFSLSKSSVGKQMSLANAAKSHLVVFVGGDEERNNTVKVKNMISGEESIVEKDKLVETIKQTLSGSRIK